MTDVTDETIRDERETEAADEAAPVGAERDITDAADEADEVEAEEVATDEAPASDAADAAEDDADAAESDAVDADADAADADPDAGDELDDLLGMAGADVEEDVAGEEPATTDAPEDADDADAAESDAAEDDGDAAEDAAVAEDETPPAEEKRKRPRRPDSIDDVLDQKDLRRMKGRWFVVHTYAGYEQRVKDNLTNRVETYDAWDRIHEIVIPTEEVTEYKKGKKVVSDKKFLPGYVLVRMDMDDDTWGIVRHTPAVTGFVGANGIKPVPLSLREVASTLQIPKEYIEEPEEGAEAGGEGGEGAHVVPEKPQIDIDLEVGETVRVTTGPFADFTGTIDEINLDQAKLRVLVSVFGRETPIEIPFDNVASI